MPHKSWKNDKFEKVKDLPGYDPNKEYKCGCCGDKAFYFNYNLDRLYCGDCADDPPEEI